MGVVGVGESRLRLVGTGQQTPLGHLQQSDQREPEAPSVSSSPERPQTTRHSLGIHRHFLTVLYCPGHAGVKGNDRADTETGGKSNHHRRDTSRKTV